MTITAVVIICITILALTYIVLGFMAITMCKHTWKETDITDFRRDGGHAYRKYYMVCTKCGKRKSVKT